jgi:SAM-dependent MidA family methyltransferase
VTIGHPELVAAISSEIQSFGPIPFVRFMELALYHPQFGYYMRPPDSGTERIGWSGDFYTNSDVHAILGEAVARQVQQIDALLGHPDLFTMVEMGAGKGLFARDVLTALERQPESFRRRFRYVLIERSPAMREFQRATLAPWLGTSGTVTWLEGLTSLPTGSLVGVFFSNELPDAFPVHRIQTTAGRIDEIFVEYRDGRFMECLRPPSTPVLGDYLRRLDVHLPDGSRTEINLQAVHWMQQVAAVLDRGVVLTIDYGHTAQDLYGPERTQGTLLCYFSQMTSDDPYTRVGLQDMTAHVDFSTLASVGEEQGLHLTGFTNQMSFLMGLGLDEMLAGLDPEGADFRAALHLLKPEGMGRTFKVLIQHKGIERPELDGLRFKPFFGSVLAPDRGRGERHEAIDQHLPSSRSPFTPSLRA